LKNRQGFGITLVPPSGYLYGNLELSLYLNAKNKEKDEGKKIQKSEET
jgi:hypothetical protein